MTTTYRPADATPCKAAELSLENVHVDSLLSAKLSGKPGATVDALTQESSAHTVVESGSTGTGSGDDSELSDEASDGSPVETVSAVAALDAAAPIKMRSAIGNEAAVRPMQVKPMPLVQVEGAPGAAAPPTKIGPRKETPREIYGVGRNFNRELGVGAYRTGGEMKMVCDLQAMLAFTRRNILECAKDPEHSIRLFVQGSKFWFSECTPEELLGHVLVECGGPTTARDIRLRDAKDDLVPACICVCEAREPLEDGSPTSVCQWLFRHDVIDGWRSLRYLFTCGFDTHTLVHDKLKARYDAKKAANAKSSALAKVGKAVVRSAAAVALTPAALLELKRISSVAQYGERRKFYAHVVVPLEALKAIGTEQKLGSLGNVLTCVILEAYFAADPSKTRANVGNSVLFNPDAPHGNHMYA